MKKSRVIYRNDRPEPLSGIRSVAIDIQKGRAFALMTRKTRYGIFTPGPVPIGSQPIPRAEQLRRLHAWRDKIVTLDARVCARITQLEDEITAGLS